MKRIDIASWIESHIVNDGFETFLVDWWELVESETLPLHNNTQNTSINNSNNKKQAEQHKNSF